MYRHRAVKSPIPNRLPTVADERTYRIANDDELALVHDGIVTFRKRSNHAIRYAPAQAQSMIDEGQTFSAKAMLVALARQTEKEFFRGRAWDDGVPGILRAAILVQYKFYVWAAFWQLWAAPNTQ